MPLSDCPLGEISTDVDSRVAGGIVTTFDGSRWKIVSQKNVGDTEVFLVHSDVIDPKAVPYATWGVIAKKGDRMRSSFSYQESAKREFDAIV